MQQSAAIVKAFLRQLGDSDRDLAEQYDEKFSVLVCRRFVFAPVCRGVTSKRSSVGDHHYIQPKNLFDKQEVNSLIDLFSTHG